MSNIDERISRILPRLQKMVADDERRFEESFQVDQSVEPMLGDIKPEEREEAREGLTNFYRGVSASLFRSFAEVEEAQQLAKLGVANALRALGYNASIDGMLQGYSGNQYYVSVVAPSQDRTLIVDQTILTSQFSMDWFKDDLPSTFDKFKVTVADFFKFLDISMGLHGKPSIYWLHDYNVEPELSNKIGFHPKKWVGETIAKLGRAQGMTEQEIEAQMLSDEDLIQMLRGMNSGILTATRILGPIQKISEDRRRPLPFDVPKTAKKFYVPYISTSLLDMLEAGTLNPNSLTDARILKGICVELGLIDYLNPPWPDFVLELASEGPAKVDQAGGVLASAEKVGHPARNVEPLGITPESVKQDPLEGLEVLQQRNLVITGQKETFRLTAPGKEYVREVHKKPKVNAIKKAVDLLTSHFSIGVATPVGSVTVQKKDNEDEEEN